MCLEDKKKVTESKKAKVSRAENKKKKKKK